MKHLIRTITAMAFGIALIAATASAQPDLTPGNGLITGRAGFSKAFDCGSRITLNRADAAKMVGANYEFQFTFRVRNAGAAPSPNPTDGLTLDGILIGNPPFAPNPVPAGPIPPAGVKTHTVSLNFSPGVWHTIVLSLDTPGAVAESNEGNNRCTIYVQVL